MPSLDMTEEPISRLALARKLAGGQDDMPARSPSNVIDILETSAQPYQPPVTCTGR